MHIGPEGGKGGGGVGRASKFPRLDLIFFLISPERHSRGEGGERDSKSFAKTSGRFSQIVFFSSTQSSEKMLTKRVFTFRDDYAKN